MAGKPHDRKTAAEFLKIAVGSDQSTSPDGWIVVFWQRP